MKPDQNYTSYQFIILFISKCILFIISQTNVQIANMTFEQDYKCVGKFRIFGADANQIGPILKWSKIFKPTVS